MGSRLKFVCSTSTYWDLHYRANFYKFERNTVVIFSLGSVFSRGSRTPYWGLEQSPSWMPASSRKGKSSGGEGPAGPWHRDGHRVRSANQTSRPERKLHIWVAMLLIFFLSQSHICSWMILLYAWRVSSYAEKLGMQRLLRRSSSDKFLCISHAVHLPQAEQMYILTLNSEMVRVFL